MKANNRWLNIIAVLIVTLMLTGCLGGGGKVNLPDQTVPQFLEEVTDAVASLQATRIADLIYFPIISGTGEPLAVLGSNNVGIMVNESAERIELRIKRDEFLDKQEWTEEFDLTQELLPFKLKKVNKKWKFNLDVDPDRPNLDFFISYPYKEFSLNLVYI